MFKRIFDVVVAGALLIVMFPIMTVLAVLIYLLLGRPVIFCQKRPGRHGNPFYIYKFRTLTNARRQDGALLPDKERVTSIGKFIRSTSMDELPQLWNVLLGDMSLVGPRPLLMEYLDLYTREQARRHDVRPGITGMAQIYGRNTLSWEDRFTLDIEYVDNHTILLDLKIICISVIKVLRREGIRHDGQVTMKKFEGSSI